MNQQPSPESESPTSETPSPEKINTESASSIPESPESPESPPATDGDQPPKARLDWLSIILTGISFSCVICGTGLTHGLTWFSEQAFMLSGLVWDIFYWPSVISIQGILFFIPLLLLSLFWQTERYQTVFKVWAIASLAILFLLPVRLIPANQAYTANLWQIGGLLIHLLSIWLLIRRRVKRGGHGFIKPRGPYWPTLCLAPVLVYSWLAIGTFGSLLDTFLNVTIALLFGLAAGLISGHFLLPVLQRTAESRAWNLALGGLGLAGYLMLMGGALGFNGSQLILISLLPPLAWLTLSLSYFDETPPQENWLQVALFIGILTAAPLTLVDPDEIVLALGIAPGEILGWIVQAGLITVIGGVLLSLGLFFFQQRLTEWLTSNTIWGGITAAWGIALLIYIFAGQPGFYGDRYFVILKDQTDVTMAASIEDPIWRREFVYTKLVEHADKTQVNLRATFDQFGLDYKPYYLVNAIEVEANPLLLLWLRSQPEVDRVLDSIVLRPLPAPLPIQGGPRENPPDAPAWNLTSIGADQVWADFEVRGEGVIIGQSDSGVQGDHPELQATYRGRDGTDNYNWYDPWNGTTAPTDLGGHGTHTLGSIVGQTVGVAPEAIWYGCVNLARNLANPALYLDCMQFMLAPFPQDGNPLTDGDSSLGANILNNSWGCPVIEGCDATALQPAVIALRAAGVFVVASAGNDGVGGCETIQSPLALYDDAFSVGAIDKNGLLGIFSSLGPVTADDSGRVKPDITAPGVDILSAALNNTYAVQSGTSMAGPHVVGVVALIWSANPTLIGQIDATEQILQETAKPYDYSLPLCARDPNSTEITYPNNAVGYGLVDAYAAVARALEMR